MRLIADMIAFTVDEVPQLEPDQHLLVPPAGGRRHAGAGDRLRALHRAWRCSTGCAARVPDETFPRVFGRISFFVNAGIRFVEEHAKLRAMGRLWEEIGRERYGVDDERLPALPLRRAGQLARPDRVAAREQHHPDRARGAGRHDGPRRPRPRAPAAGLERGARAAAAVGPAVVAADPADPRLRDRPARVPRHLRGLEGDGRARRRADRGRARGDGRGGRAAAAPSRRCRT